MASPTRDSDPRESGSQRFRGSVDHALHHRKCRIHAGTQQRGALGAALVFGVQVHARSDGRRCFSSTASEKPGLGERSALDRLESGVGDRGVEAAGEQQFGGVD
jgi:hypothetical protein